MIELRDDFAIGATPARRAGSPLARALAAFAAWRAAAARRAAERAAIERLSTIDDHILRDIGLTRGDLASRIRGEDD